MRFLVSLAIAYIFSGSALAQNVAPPWPDLKLDSCPALAQPRSPTERKWKHGEPERDSFVAARQMLQSKNYVGAADAEAKFAEEFPDSDYRDPALMMALAAQGYLRDKAGHVRIAAQLVRFPVAEPSSREVGFVTLSDDLSPYLRPDDPEKERKLRDLETWTRCGKEALAANVRSPDMPQETFEGLHKTSESVLDRTAGFVAYMRQDYVLANTELQAAIKLNPRSALASLWLATNEFFLPDPDPNNGIFYLARFAELAPQGPWAAPEAGDAAATFLKQMYVMVHGSEKGLSDLRTLARDNAVPPPGFNVLPKPKEKHHYGSAIAATAIAGLLVYGFVRHPELMGEIGRSLGAGAAGQSASMKIMIFGGPDHRTYLGCLSCSQLDVDSVFNNVGQYGSRYRTESIWNSYGEFGSPYSEFSACSPYANDPPVIVDQAGNAYGRLTVNHANAQIGAGARFCTWLALTVCHY